MSDFPNLSIEYWKGVLSGDSDDTEHEVALVRLYGDRREILAAGTREIHPWLQKLDDEGRAAAKKAAYRIAGFLQRPVIDRTKEWSVPALCQNMPRQPFPDPARLSNTFSDCCSWSDGQLSLKDASGLELMKITGNPIRMTRCSLYRAGSQTEKISDIPVITRENLTDIFVTTCDSFSQRSLIRRSETREFAVSGFWTEEDAFWLRSAVISMLCQ